MKKEVANPSFTDHSPADQIVIHNFSAKRGSFTLFPLSFTVKKGEIFAILGRTGSGKTVLLEAISGMFPGDTGEILLDGINVCRIPLGERKLGLVYQDYSLFPHMKVKDNISYGLKMHGFSRQEREARAMELMELLSITHIKEQYPGTLSGGESQRTALARALALNPQVLLLDEPFSALDPSTRQSLYRELRNIHAHFHCTIIFVTHDFSEARTLADRAAILLEGKLMAVTPAGALETGYFTPEVNAFLGRGGQEEQSPRTGHLTETSYFSKKNKEKIYDPYRSI